jgi:hypothetical protein
VSSLRTNAVSYETGAHWRHAPLAERTEERPPSGANADAREAMEKRTSMAAEGAYMVWCSATPRDEEGRGVARAGGETS